MSLVLQVDILGEFKNLTAATKGAQSDLQKMNARAAKVSASIKKAFAAIGVGFSLGIIKRELEEAGKAAAEDAKSQALLAKALENTTGANSDQIASVEKVISKLQLQASVADDQLRPAYAKLLRSTKDTEEANKLLAIALDVSAGSGKSLDAVAQAMAKSVSGSDTALVRLLPSVKGVTDPMAYLAEQFKGAAAEAANTDPYQRMQIIFGEMQEQIGVALLPLLNEFSTWLATPEGQAKLQEIVDGFKAIITQGAELVGWVIDNKDWLVPMVAAIGTVTAAWNLAIGAVKTYQALAGIGALVGGGAAAGGVVGGVAAGSAIGGYQQGQVLGQQSKIYGEGFKQLGSKVLGKNSGTTVNINVKAINDARSTINEVKRFQNSTGISLGRALQG